ncbi:hypothetical protein INR49_008777 [Caranx melampygus]|nr:hypothetical protein INR49_008777 [Caranx melampygus]
MTQPVTCAVSNIICSLVYGSRFDYDDPEFTSMVDRTNNMVNLSAPPQVQQEISSVIGSRQVQVEDRKNCPSLTPSSTRLREWPTSSFFTSSQTSRRVCLGESFGQMELFIFFTTLLQHFRFTPAPGVSEETWI